jgi:RHS repeat-associated protein
MQQVDTPDRQKTSPVYPEPTQRSYYRARYYDPLVGRFWSEDPLRFFSGDANFYAYVEQNPINLLDPRGLTCYCTYSQASGHLKCVDAETGDVVADTIGYAGNGLGKNNPLVNGANNVGPLPRGNYMMGAAGKSKNTGPITIPLFYIGGDEPFPSDRSPNLMRIHGDAIGKPQGNASKGCMLRRLRIPERKSQLGADQGVF